ncbi:hypothetical protein FHR34_001485 [Kitasatospora kifunensis]|uniref:Uncharacterized protein n=2 Tax=Kitasatospora kifunensis TaxID=58351 RepID=A0A7W7QZ52_KITKI|nr:hypothetical protein [Kitasatospora kifunensis]
MSMRQLVGPGTALLRRLREPAPPQPERCEFCDVRLPGEHRHLADRDERSLVCVCTACALLLRQPGAAEGRYRGLSERYLADPEHQLTEIHWQALRIPVSCAFLFRDTALERLVTLYPSPAGAAESELDEAASQALLDASRLAAALEPDTEALLLRRTEGRIDCYLVPIDVCYELVGRLRLCWHGFDGGAQARAELDGFFARLAERTATPRVEVLS